MEDEVLSRFDDFTRSSAVRVLYSNGWTEQALPEVRQSIPLERPCEPEEKRKVPLYMQLTQPFPRSVARPARPLLRHPEPKREPLKAPKVQESSAKYHKEWREKNPDKVLARNEARRKTPKLRGENVPVSLKQPTARIPHTKVDPALRVCGCGKPKFSTREKCKTCLTPARKHQWEQDNREKIRKYHLEWRKANPEREQGYNRKWAAENPDKIRAKSQRHRDRAKARKLASSTQVSVQAAGQ